MATFDELLTASANTGLINKVRVATFVAATVVMTEDIGVDNHANRLLWARTVFSDPTGAGQKMMWAVLGQNRALTLAQMTSASDTDVLAAVTAAIDVFAGV